jgi:hypothetical protein
MNKSLSTHINSLRLLKKGPNARRGDEAIAVTIDRSRNNTVGPFLSKPVGQSRFLEKLNFFAPYVGSACRLRASQKNLIFLKTRLCAGY